MMPPAPSTEYEAERARRIAENRSRMEQLGLLKASQAFVGSAEYAQSAQRTARAPRRKKARSNPKEIRSAVPPRESKRLRGHKAVDPDNSVVGTRTEAHTAETQEEHVKAPLGYTSKGTARKLLTLNTNTTYAAPFTLRSIETTIWELGTIHRGAWAPSYWSNRNCLFHHAYPVGYRATKNVFGRTYEMCIEARATGPIFSVRDTEGVRVFEGNSPTKPWTDVCIAHRTGQRISGPLFFGFSDPVIHQAIASCLYNERELAAALAGETVEAENLSSEERAAKEFMAIDGVGKKVSAVLANTLSLGGKQHAGLESLKRWTLDNLAENKERLVHFLLDSEEIPSATRNWPLWKMRFVPMIVADLVGDNQGQYQDPLKENKMPNNFIGEEAIAGRQDLQKVADS